MPSILKKEFINTMKKDLANLVNPASPSGAGAFGAPIQNKIAEPKIEVAETGKKSAGFEMEKKQAEERQKEKEEQAKLKAEEDRRMRAEQLKKEEENRLKAEEERKKREEEKIKAEQIRKAEELKRQEEERLKKEEENRIRMEQIKEREKIEQERRQKEKEKLEAERKIKEELRKKEEQKRKEEEEKRRRESPQYKKEILLEKKKIILEEKLKLDKEVKNLEMKMRPLEAPRSALMREIEGINKAVNVIFEQERRIEKEEEDIEKRESEAKNPADKKEIEKERWMIEDKRRDLETKRWPWEEKVKEINEKIKAIDLAHSDLERKKDEAKEKGNQLETSLKKIDFEIEQINLKDEIIKARGIKKVLEEEKKSLFNEIDEIERKLAYIYAEEVKVEADKRLVEEEEKMAENLDARKELENSRWKAEEKRRQIEAMRWKYEEEKEGKEKLVLLNDKKSEELFEKVDKFSKRIKEIDIDLGTQTINVSELGKEFPLAAKPIPKILPKIAEKPIAKPAPVSDPVSAPVALPIKKELVETKITKEPINGQPKNNASDAVFEQAKKRLENLKNSAPQDKIVPQDNKEELRKQLVSKLQSNPIAKRENPMPIIGAGKASPPSNIPPKPSGGEKLWIRLIVFLLVFGLLMGIATFWYWWIVVRNQPPVSTIECAVNDDCDKGKICRDARCIPMPITKCQTDADCESDKTCGSNGECLVKAAITQAPVPLFATDIEKREAIISDAGQVKNYLKQWIQEDQEKGTFQRIIFKEGNNYLLLPDILSALEVRAPANFYSSLGENFTFFTHSQIEGNRIGFVAEIADTGKLIDVMRGEEISMKVDFAPMFDLMEKGAVPKVQQFRDAIILPGYKGPNFRFLTIGTNDTGLCYLISSDRFIFTTSLSAMQKIIERMAIEIPATELTRDLDLNSTGDDVRLLQTWLASDPSIYSVGLITGKYGSLTRAAVKKIQEKYASEILAPQGLSEGTGKVDERTRMKLNELYAKSGMRPKAVELLNDLRFGKSGDEVRLLQTWLAKDSVIYPQGLVTGWFGTLTESAVKKFQKKYESELLTPYGLSDPTGIVDKATRIKLNEIYKK